MQDSFNKEPISVCIDGENYIHKEVKVEIKKDALRFWLPKGVEIYSDTVYEELAH